MADRNDQRLVVIAGSGCGDTVAERLGGRDTGVVGRDTDGRTPAPDEGTAA
ncbi:hypothetical protein ABZX30_15320 [Streptomyces sp. NPDC004542]|uniref:hypothetical protein n=1 Tax=Streptomyces sp. NPDC004542 TaxID=3154281 RepID=UPI0033ACB00E